MLNPTNTYFYNHLQMERHHKKSERLKKRLASCLLKEQEYLDRLNSKKEWRERLHQETSPQVVVKGRDTRGRFQKREEVAA